MREPPSSAPPFFPAETSHPAPPPPRRLRRFSTPESRFWRSYRSCELISKLVLPVTHLSFSPSSPHYLALASSASLRLFSPKTLDQTLTLTHFPDVAFSPSFRCDGSLIAAGSASGLILCFRPDKPSQPLRRLRSHSRSVRVVKYPRVADKLRLLSGGDDAVINLWDVSSETVLSSLPTSHLDYIRGGDASPVSPDIFATGSYDHTVKLWDFRAREQSQVKPIMQINHGEPVESVLFLPSGGIVASAGGNTVKLWDVMGGARLLHTIEGHNKTVTDLAVGRFDDAESRIMSVSIDGYFKVFDYAAFRFTHSMRFPAQLLSVAFSPDGSAWAVGASKGIAYAGIRKKKKDEELGSHVADEFPRINLPPKKPPLGPTNFRYFRRGQSEKPAETDYVVSKPARVKLAEHDKLLKKFRHREALVSVLNKRNPNSVVAVLEELVARRKLLRCVANLDLNELGMLLSFLHRFVTIPRYAKFLMGLTKKVIEMRSEDIGSSGELSGHVRNLKRMVAEEMKVQRSMLEIQGMISPLLAIAGR